MNKKIVYMIAALVLLAVLASVYLINKDNTDNADNTAESTDTTQTEAAVYVTDISGAAQITLKNTHGSYTAKYAGNKYFIEGYENNTISQNDLKYLFSLYSNLKAERLVEENAADMSKYGLSEDICVNIAGDTQAALLIGSLTSDKKYRYVGCGSNVYIVNNGFCELALRDIKDFINTSVTTVSASDADYVHIVVQGKPEILIESAENNSIIKEYASTSGLSALLMVSPIENAIVYPTNMRESILSDLSNITFNSVEDLKPSDLSKYGLDAPTAEITIKAGDDELNIKKGNAFDENSFYVLTDDRPEVYTMTKDCFNAFENTDVMDYIQPFVSLHSRSAVESVIYTTPNGSYTIELKSEGDNTIAADSEGVKRDNRNTYINGTLIDKETFGDFYEMLAGISFDSVEYNKSMDKNTPAYTIEYKLSDGTVDKSVMYEYNDNFCFMDSDGNILLVNKQQLVQLEDNIIELSKGEE